MKSRIYGVFFGGMFPVICGAALNEGTPPMPSFAPNQGVLSYTFFNLSPATCTFTPEGASGNPAAYSAWGQNNGWMNSGEWDAPGFFNPNGIPYQIGNDKNYTYYYSKSGTSNYFTSSYIFYDWPDSPIATPLPPEQVLSVGENFNASLNSAGVDNPSWNTPAMGDSWYVSCDYTNGSSSAKVPFAIASFASSQNALVSNETWFYVYNSSDDFWYLSTNYWYPSYPGWFANSSISPTAQGNPSGPDQPCYGGAYPYTYTCAWPGSYGAQCLDNPQDYTNPESNSTTWPSNPNPCGAGFTSPSPQSGSIAYNWNNNSSSIGGLWSGINYDGQNAVTPYPAVLSVNMPMLPINLAAYVGYNSNNPAQLTPPVSWTPIMGGHFTYAIGDPFIVSSFAAKILSYMAISQNSQLNNNSNLSSVSFGLSGDSFQTCPTTQNPSKVCPLPPVFGTNTYAFDYVQWLLGSQSSSQNYTGAPQLAAQAFKTTYTAATQNIKTSTSIWGTIFEDLADTAINAIASAINLIPGGKVATAVVGAVTSTSSGIATANVNSAIMSAYTTSTNPTQPLSTNAPAVVNPTYSSGDLLGAFLTNSGVQSAINTSMATTSGWPTTNPNPFYSNYSVYNSGDCQNLNVTANLFSGLCGSTNNSGTPTGQNFIPYSNVYPGQSTMNGTPTSNQLSIWTAILTGSDVQTNDDGWIVLGDSADGSAPFQPPFQLYSPETPSFMPTGSSNPGITITFNANTFTLTAQSIVFNPPPNTPCPSSTQGITGSNPTTCEYSLGDTAPNLSYLSCITDTQATGGIIATFSPDLSTTTPPQVVLACACIPNYLGGPAPSTSSTVSFVTGIASNNNNMPCTAYGS